VNIGGLYYTTLFSPDALVAELKQKNISLTPAYSDIPSLLSKILAGTGGYELVNFWNAFSKPIFAASPPALKPISVSNVPRWASVGPLFTQQDSLFTGPFATQNKNDMWYPGQEGKALALCPALWGLDTLGYNPELVDKDLTSWGDLVDRQWKGKVAIQDIPTVAINYWALYLTKAGQMTAPSGPINDLDKASVDTVVNFLAQNKKAGQFRTLWGEYGTAVNLLTSKEVWIADVWSGIAVSAREAGVPVEYIMPKEGGAYWFAGVGVTTHTTDDKLNAIYTILDTYLGSPSWVKVQADLGYQAATYTSDETKKALGPEYYDWTYQGKRTYKPLSQIFPDKSARVGNALFAPGKYSWSQNAGTPDANGALRWHGSVDNRIKNIGFPETWQTNGDYYFSAWNTFKSA
jgi:spermidine/putrescine-binding protein